MSGRHVATHGAEEDQALPPQIVFTKAPVGRAVREAFPELVDVIDREYHVGLWADEGERYLILVRNDRTPVRFYGEALWPCYR